MFILEYLSQIYDIFIFEDEYSQVVFITSQNACESR